MKRKLLALLTITLPVCAVALVYRYDPSARLAQLQLNFQGGVHQISSYCQSKYILRTKALSNLGVTESSQKSLDRQYQFMATCIYGKQAYKAANCEYGSMACQKVVLPLKWPAIEFNLKSMKPERVSAAKAAPISIY